MDLATIIGIVVGVVLVTLSILLTGDLMAFVSASSALIVFGGTLAATLVAFPIGSVMGSVKAIISLFAAHKIDFVKVVRTMIQGAEANRTGGGPALEKIKVDDAYVRLAFQLVADGTKAAEVQDLLRIEREATIARRAEEKKILEKMGELAPAWGMIGTLIGLVIMLMNLSDPSSIGPAMAVALLTTLYGALAANFVLLPGATKLEERADREEIKMLLVAEGAAAMARNENPRQVQQRLLGFMPPEVRSQIQARKMAAKKK